jgi:hypothetical protein
METLAEYIVRHRKSLKHFSTLHSNFLEEKRENEMSTPTSSNSLNTTGSAPVKIQIGREQTVSDLGRKAEPASASKPSTPVNSGMAVDSQVNVGEIKPVDRRTIEGSYNGKTQGYDREDTTGVGAQFSTDFAKDSPSPRQGMTQSKVTSSKLDYPLPAVTVTDETEPTSEVE